MRGRWGTRTLARERGDVRRESARGRDAPARYRRASRVARLAGISRPRSRTKRRPPRGTRKAAVVPRRVMCWQHVIGRATAGGLTGTIPGRSVVFARTVSIRTDRNHRSIEEIPDTGRGCELCRAEECWPSAAARRLHSKIFLRVPCRWGPPTSRRASGDAPRRLARRPPRHGRDRNLDRVLERGRRAHDRPTRTRRSRPRAPCVESCR